MRIRLEEPVLEDAGYRRAYPPETESLPIPPQASRLRGLKSGERFTPRQVQVVKKGMDEAKLIRALEEKGIGRPSTYALTITRLVDHGYLHRRPDGGLEITDFGVSVLGFLTKQYPRLFSYTFTKEMEHNLDALAQGKKAYGDVIRAVWTLLQE